MPRLRPALIPLFAALLLLPTSSLQAEVRLPKVFGDHMVLQRDTPVPVWGWGEPGETVTVSIREQQQTARVDDAGNWRVTLQPLELGDAATLTVMAPSGDQSFSDVLVGEVWVCSGQSNMKWTVGNAIDADLESLGAHHPNIRLFNVDQNTAAEPLTDLSAQWQVCTPETAPPFSAVAYYFGRNLHDVLQVPIGLIETAWGGTRAEAWTSPQAMAATEELKPILDTWADRCAKFDAAKSQQEYEAAIVSWKERVARAKQQGRPAPQRPQPPSDPRLDQHHPSNLYNAMVAPLVPFAIRGAIWYQGESNAGRAYQYRTLMPTMIQSWREAWKQGDFPFYMVQLANFREIKDEPVESDWAELREAQMMTIDALPNVGVACITDIGAAKNIHPKNKQDVGKRLARLALVDNYGFADRLTRQGPVFQSLKIEDGKALLQFDTGGSRLISYYDEPLTGFAIAGADRQWRWADAVIRPEATDVLVLSHPDVPEPVAVRYNWSDNPQGTLYNTEYLPAYPFRSDDWPGVTENNVAP